MNKYFLVLATLALISCGEKPKTEKDVIEKAVDSYGALIEKAKGTETALQKKADSILKKADSLGIPR
jgi:hypothetical protein